MVAELPAVFQLLVPVPIGVIGRTVGKGGGDVFSPSYLVGGNIIVGSGVADIGIKRGSELQTLHDLNTQVHSSQELPMGKRIGGHAGDGNRINRGELVRTVVFVATSPAAIDISDRNLGSELQCVQNDIFLTGGQIFFCLTETEVRSQGDPLAWFIVEVQSKGRPFEARSLGHSLLVEIVARKIVGGVIVSSAQA